MGPSAYDRAITVFSPDGRLFQVEYAREAVKRGTTAIGIVYDEGVLMAVDKSISTSLVVPGSIEKIFRIDKHMGAATSGLVADARRLVEDARLKAQRNKIAYNEPMTVSALVKDICNMKQLYTQYGGARPFGASLLVAGVNSKPHLFETDPSGAFTEYTAAAIGSGKRDVEKIFEKKYKADMGRGQAIELAMLGLNSVSETGIKKENIEVVTIEVGGEYKKLGLAEVAPFVEKAGKTEKLKQD